MISWSFSLVLRFSSDCLVSLEFLFPPRFPVSRWDSLPYLGLVFGFLLDSVTLRDFLVFLQDSLPSQNFLFWLPSGFSWPSAILRTPGLPSRFFAFLRICFGFLPDSVTFWSSFKILCLPRNFSFGFLLDFVWPSAILRTPGLPSRFFAFLRIYFGFLLDSLTCCGFLVFLLVSLPPSVFIWLPSGSLTFRDLRSPGLPSGFAALLGIYLASFWISDLPRFCGLLVFLLDYLPSLEFIWLPSGILIVVVFVADSGSLFGTLFLSVSGLL